MKIATLLLFLFPGFVLASDFEKLVHEPLRGSLHVDYSVAGESGPFSLPQECRVKPEDADLNLGVIVDTFHKERKAYEWKVRKENFHQFVNTVAIAGGSAAAAVGSSGLLIPVIAAGAGVTAQLRLDQVKRQMIQTIENSANSIFENSLAKVRKYDEARFRNMAGQTPVQAFKSLYGEDGADAAVFKGLQPADRETLQEHLLITMQNRMAKKDWQQDEKIKNTEFRTDLAEIGIETNRKNIIIIQNSLIKFEQETNQKFIQLQAVQQRIVERVDRLTTRVEKLEGGAAKSSADISFLQEFAFGKMSPTEQLKALEKGFFDEMSPDDRKDLQEKVQLTKDKQELVNGIGEALNAANGLLLTAKGLGLDARTCDVLGKGLAVVGAGVNIAMSLMSGNVMGMVSAIGNLMGSLFGGPDVAEQRHEQVMKALEGVFKNQEMMTKKLDDIIQTQKLIIENQIKIMQAVIDLGKRIEEQHHDAMMQLTAVQEDVLLNRELVLTGIKKPLENCGIFITQMDKKENGKSKYGYNAGHFSTYEGLYNHFHHYQDQFDGCLDAFPSYLEAPARAANREVAFHPVFYVTSYANVSNNLGGYARFTYRPTFKLLSQLFRQGEPDVLNDMIGRLFFPSPLFSDLDKKSYLKMSFYQQNEMPLGFPSAAKPLDLMENALSVAAIDEYVSNLLRIHYYFELIEDKGRIYGSATEVKNRKNVSHRGYDLLVFSLRMIDAAIAQQALVAGESLIPKLDGLIREKPDSLIYDVMAGNPILAKNLLIYMLGKDLDSRDVSYAAYQIAMQNDEAALVDHCLTHKWPVERKDGKWHVVVETSTNNQKAYVPFPTTDELIAGNIIYPDALTALQELRIKVVDELMTYSFQQRFKAPVAKSFFRAHYLKH